MKTEKKISGNKRRGLAPQFMKGKDAEKEIEIKTNEMGNRVANVYIFTISRIIIFLGAGSSKKARQIQSDRRRKIASTALNVIIK